jgi:hypothetical protein
MPFMTQNLRDSFNELAMLEKIYNQWAASVREDLPPEAVEALIATNPTERYGALDQSAFQNVKDKGPETRGYEESSRLYLKFLKNADFNMGILLSFIAKPLAFLTVGDKPDELKFLAQKYQLDNIQKLLPR